VKVRLSRLISHEVEEVDVLLDSGATGLFLDHDWCCKRLENQYTKIGNPIEVDNINRSVIEEEITERGYSHIIITKEQRTGTGLRVC